MVDDMDYLKLFDEINSNEITEKELEEIIEEELQKSEDEMDADLIEACIDRINILKAKNQPDSQMQNAEPKAKRNKPRPKKIIAVAAVVAVFLTTTVTVSAKVRDFDIIGGIVELYENYISVRFDKKSDNSDKHELLGSKLAKELKAKGFSSVLLPESIASDEENVYCVEYDYDKTDLMATANIYFYAMGRKCSMHITKYPNFNSVSSKSFPNQSSQVEQVKLDNLTLYVFGEGKKSVIVFQDGLLGYTVNLDLKFEDAVAFARTIK